MTAQLFSPSHVVVVDPTPARLDAAKRLGATVTVADADGARAAVAELTNGRGADSAIEAVGIPETFELCTQLIRPGGRVANVGVHGKAAMLHLEELWIRNVTITTGLVDTTSTPRLLALLAGGQLTGGGIVTHRFGISEMMEAYDVFSAAADTQALKVAMFRP
jgi:alcohol dehydrogenase